MLNIKDIREKRARNPEPPEIAEIRRIVKERFTGLEFIEDGHKYFLHKPNGEVTEMTCVSNICHRYEPFVDWEEKAQNVATKEGVETEVVQRRWKENNLMATSGGSLTHLFAEAYMYFYLDMVDEMPAIIRDMQYHDGFLVPYGQKQMAVAQFYEDLFQVDNFYPVMPEAKIYIVADDNPYGIKHNISGTFDALFAYKAKDGKFKLVLGDWKTNASLYKEFSINRGVMCNPPFDMEPYYNQPLSFYTIQLTLYQLGLEQAGLEVVDRRLLWLTDDGEYQKIQVPLVKDLLLSDLCK